MSPACTVDENAPAAVYHGVGLCLGCDYALRGLTEQRCPECGRPFDPGNASTMNFGRPLGRMGRWALRPVPWTVVALSLVPAAWLAWVSTDPDIYYMGMSGIASGFACFLLMIIHLGWDGARRLILLHRGQSPLLPVSDRGRWRVPWWVTLMMVPMVLTQVPLRIVFLAHQRAFEQMVREVQSDAPSCATLPGRRVGIYTLSPARPAEINGSAVMFRVNDSAEGGFAYLPNGDGELAYNSGDHGRLWGPWYWFSED